MEPTAAASHGGQVAFLDHVMVVVDAETAEAIADSHMLPGLGRFEVGTVDSDGESWTGRYLFGRRTYVEVFGPTDYAGGEPGTAGLGLSTRTRGSLATLVDRAATAGAQLATGRRSLQDEGRTMPWFDYAEADGTKPGVADPDRARSSFEIWVMEFLAASNDLELRESTYLEWSAERNDATGGAPVLGDVSEVDVGVSADDADKAVHVLEAAGFMITRQPGLVVARDAEARIAFHLTHGTGVRLIKFALVDRARQRAAHQIGRSTLTVGPGPWAEWRFASVSV